MLSPEVIGLVAAFCGGLAGGFGASKKSRDQVAALQLQLRELDRTVHALTLERSALLDHTAMLQWPDLTSPMLPI